jgi:hypothetical protein
LPIERIWGDTIIGFERRAIYLFFVLPLRMRKVVQTRGRLRIRVKFVTIQ